MTIPPTTLPSVDTISDEAPAPAPDLAKVSAMCAEGRHRRCLGRVAVLRPGKSGRAYVVCQCPVCNHPDDRRKSR